MARTRVKKITKTRKTRQVGHTEVFEVAKYVEKNTGKTVKLNTGLAQYQKTTRAAKTFAKETTGIGKQYQDYVNEYWAIGKKLRKAGVKITAGHKQAGGRGTEGFNFEDWQRADILSVKDYIRLVNKNGGLVDSKVLAEKQYNLISNDLANNLLGQIREAAQNTEIFDKRTITQIDKLTIEQVRARQIPQAIWNKMQLFVADKGVSIDEYFFGSD